MHVPRSSTPAGSLGPTTRPVDVAFHSGDGVSSCNCFFRGCISRPMHFLCTLHLASHLTRRNTRFRLVVNLGRVGISPTGLLLRTFRCLHHHFLLSRLGLAHHQSKRVGLMDTSPLRETFKDSPIFCATLKIGKKRTGHASGHCPGA